MTSQAFLTTEDLAARWRMSPGSIRNLRNSDKPHPKFFRFGFSKNSHVRYPLDEVEKFERENMMGGNV